MNINEKKNKRKKKFETKESFSSYEIDISREKIKARELRNSSWWKKRCSSGICYYCGKKFLPYRLTMDHVIPLSRGGRSEKYNLVPACKDCNTKKKYLLPVEWDEYLETIKNTQK